MKLSPYPVYKESGIDWLPFIPEGWSKVKLKHRASFTTGWTPPTGDDASYIGENLWANISDLGSPVINNTAKRISNEAVSKANVEISPKNSLLFSFKLSIGQVSFVGEDMYTNEAIATFQPNQCIDVNYGYYCYPIFVVKNASENIYGAKLLNQDLIKNAVIGLPNLSEQLLISKFLNRETAKIDTLIAKQEKLIELLQEKRQAIISHAITKGLDSNAKMKDSGVEWLAMIPEHWICAAIKHIVSIPITDGPHETPNFYDFGVPFVSAEAVSGGQIDFSKIRGYISKEDHEKYSKKYKPSLGDVYMIKSGATTGVTAIVETEIEFNIWSPLAVIRCGSKMLPRFALYFMRSFNFQEAVSLNWSFGTQQNIGMNVIENLSITIPPVKEQLNIIKYLDELTSSIDLLIEKSKLSIALAKEHRTALISAAVTGKIDVREYA